MPKYTFSTNIPQAAQRISATQAPIESNFQSFSEFININHYGFNSPNQGKHTYTSLPIQSSDPSTAAAEMAVYSKETPSGPNIAELFYRYPSDGTVVQLTNSGSINTSAGLNETNGWALLSPQTTNSWPVMMQWGQQTGIVTATGAGNIINFVTGAGIPTWTYSSTGVAILVTISGSSSSGWSSYCVTGSPGTSNFGLRVPGVVNGGIINWLAIGICTLP